MEKMDKIVLFGFGGLILFGSIAQTFIQNETIKNAIVGIFYIIFVGIIFLTEVYAKVEASSHHHLKIILRYKGVWYLRDWFFDDYEQIGKGVDLDPMGNFKYAYKIPLVRSSIFPQPFGRSFRVYVLCKRPFSENFNFVNNGERVANWNGIGVEHVSDISEVDLDSMPHEENTKLYPVVCLDRTGKDAEERAAILDEYHKQFEDIEPMITEELKNEVNGN